MEGAMGKSLADFVVHIDETLTSERLDTIEKHIHDLDGVVCACNRRDQPHLMTVVYSPEKVEAHDILVNIEKEGVHAELVGL